MLWKRRLDRQVEQAKKVRQLHHALGAPFVKDFTVILKMNAIKNIPINFDDINLAKQIFRLDNGAFKGKAKRSKPAHVISDCIEIPSELVDNHHNAILYLDIIKINGLIFLTTILRNIIFQTD